MEHLLKKVIDIINIIMQNNIKKGGDIVEKQYKIKEICSILGVTRQCIYNWEKQGKIKFNRVNGLPRIAESELRRIVKGE